MVVQHNLTAMNSNRMLGVTTKTQAKSTEKLSSGYKINRAADDAAGLSISEKMRKQVRGLTQASSNAQDGISTVQTAEGALNEVQDMLQRMNELAVKSANGTNNADDRSYIQNEIGQLVTEIDRVSTTTKFNVTYLLRGDARGTVSATPADQTVTSKLADVKLNAAAGSELVAGDVVLGKVTAEVENNAGGALIGDLSGSVLDALNNAADGRLFPFCLFFICHLITFSQQIHPYSKPSQQVSAIFLRYPDPAHLGFFCEVLPGYLHNPLTIP